MKIIEDFGLKFRQQRDGYYRCTILMGNKRVNYHRYKYEQLIGKIPKGFDIHHKDRNKDNNSIDNLTIAHESSHRRYHNIVDGLNKKLSERNKDPKFIAKVKETRLKLMVKDIEKTCEFCTSIFKTSSLFKRKRFCSLRCYMKWYNKNKR